MISFFKGTKKSFVREHPLTHGTHKQTKLQKGE